MYIEKVLLTSLTSNICWLISAPKGGWVAHCRPEAMLSRPASPPGMINTRSRPTVGSRAISVRKERKQMTLIYKIWLKIDSYQ